MNRKPEGDVVVVVGVLVILAVAAALFLVGLQVVAQLG